MNQRRKCLRCYITQQEAHVNELKGAWRKHFPSEVMHILHHIADIRYVSEDMPQGLVDKVGAFIDPDDLHIGMPPRDLIGPRAHAAAHIEYATNSGKVKPGWQNIAHQFGQTPVL